MLGNLDGRGIFKDSRENVGCGVYFDFMLRLNSVDFLLSGIVSDEY